MFFFGIALSFMTGVGVYVYADTILVLFPHKAALSCSSFKGWDFQCSHRHMNIKKYCLKDGNSLADPLVHGDYAHLPSSS